MQISKWGNSLAIRLPRAVVETLKLKEGDEVEVVVSGKRRFAVARDTTRDAAVARLKATKWKLPKGFRFDRDEANER